MAFSCWSPGIRNIFRATSVFRLVWAEQRPILHQKEKASLLRKEKGRTRGQSSLSLKPHELMPTLLRRDSLFPKQPPCHHRLFYSVILAADWHVSFCLGTSWAHGKFIEMCRFSCGWQFWSCRAPHISTEGAPWGTAVHSAGNHHKPTDWQCPLYSLEVNYFHRTIVALLVCSTPYDHRIFWNITCLLWLYSWADQVQVDQFAWTL